MSSILCEPESPAAYETPAGLERPERRDTLFALVDCNNFYVSCERVFNPNLEGKPVVVLSNNDGCIISRSNEAKALGIKMAVPFFEVRELIEKVGVEVYSANFTLYGDLSRRVINTLARFTPEYEVYSIDEVFLNLSGFERAGLADYARQIVATVKKWTGIPISIGIAPTKTLAKLANKLAKKSPEWGGALDWTAVSDPEQKLARFEIGDLWGIGHKSEKRLQKAGIFSALELRNANDKWILKEMGVVGQRIVFELRGISCLPLEMVRSARKSVLCSRSFGRAVENLEELKQAVAEFTSQAAETLREDRLSAKYLTVFSITRPHSEEARTHSRTAELPVATDSTPELIRTALREAEKIFFPGGRFKKAGVAFSGLVPTDEVQTDIFDGQNRTRAQKLMQALDEVNARQGAGALRYAASGIQQPWRMKSSHRSKRFTTRWEDLLEARTVA
ncbi:MAG TPA: Y-family DNA polymerase [candidate division Zixibacteria bacterium]|nr:Y-family DNA polymerase [candidate division Zixibacteria bacterium]